LGPSWQSGFFLAVSCVERLPLELVVREDLVSTVLNENEVRALHEALDDEYRAFATYDQVIHDFGSVRPFINIRAAENRHIDALTSV